MRLAEGGDRRSESYEKNKVWQIYQRLKNQSMSVQNLQKQQAYRNAHIQWVKKS